MWRRRQHSVHWAVALICGGALVSLAVFQYDARHPRNASVEAAREQFAAKCEPLAPLLPSGEVIRFVLDRSHRDPTWTDLGGWLYLAQYVLSPRLLAADAPSQWVIVDSAGPESVPEIAIKSGWTLVADLHNGMRLYRTNVPE
jgi:hypothetical protein